MFVEGSTEIVDHVVHFSLIDPHGRNLEYYKSNLLTQAGQGVWKPKMALNETAGLWHIEAKDVISGITVRLPFSVIEAEN